MECTHSSNISPFGKLPGGQQVEQYTLTNAHGLILRAITYGGIVTQLHVPDRTGRLADIVCGFDRLHAYLAGHPYFGCIVGRVAGRIARGQFTLDGVPYHLAINDPPNHLHGGWRGFDKRIWSADQFDGQTLRLTYISPHGEEGYPGNVQVAVTYTLTDVDEFIITFEATTDRPTPLNLTHHGYYNLAGEGSGPIDDHLLQIHANHYAPTDETMTLLGTREPVMNRANDFRIPRRIGDVLGQLWKSHGDLYFVARHAADGLISVARLTDPRWGRVMTIESTAPCVQLYTGVGLDGSLCGKAGRPYQRHCALCLECQSYPDGTDLPQLGDIVLRPGQTYRHTIVHHFTTVS